MIIHVVSSCFDPKIGRQAARASRSMRMRKQLVSGRMREESIRTYHAFRRVEHVVFATMCVYIKSLIHFFKIRHRMQFISYMATVHQIIRVGPTLGNQVARDRKPDFPSCLFYNRSRGCFRVFERRFTCHNQQQCLVTPPRPFEPNIALPR